MNHNTLKCEACDHSCGSCTGPLPTDCLTCKSGLQMDNAHGCVPCCANSGNSVETEFSSDCCQCLTPNGPCSSKDRPRSIQNYDNVHLKLPSNSIFTGLSFVLFLCFGVLVIVSVLLLKGTNARRPFTYRKVTSNYQKRRSKDNMERKLNYIFEDEDDDDCELMLYEKT